MVLRADISKTIPLASTFTDICKKKVKKTGSPAMYQHKHNSQLKKHSVLALCFSKLKKLN